MLGVDGLPRGVQIIAASFGGHTAIACAAMLEALDGLELGGQAYVYTIRDRGKCFRQVRPVSVIAHGWKPHNLLQRDGFTIQFEN